MRQMAWAFEDLLRRLPIGDIAAGVRADRRIGEYDVGGIRLGLRVETVSIEAKQEDLVEPGTIADDAAFGSSGHAMSCFSPNAMSATVSGR